MTNSEMTPERWKQVQWLFDAVLQREPADRPAFLEEATAEDPTLRREVDSLIRSLESASRFIEQPAVDLVNREETEVFAAGTRVGTYRLERLLGSGGAGQVFLASRADAAYEKQVAIKVIKRGMDTEELLRRFLSERQILAQLEHPNIAKLLDGGATEDGRPYLVMEFVDGQPMDRWCAENELNVEERLHLFLAVCSAVHFAHRNLVIHRDLKPGNILVGQGGVPKLLDFGIAKLLEPEAFPKTVLPTAPGWRAMTPEYASPEQVRGATVTTASDVYSLGVVLYELLTGHRPYKITDYAPSAIEQAVCHQEPQRASKVARSTVGDGHGEPKGGMKARELERRLAGDLDDILRMALEKEAERRYPSVDHFAADIKRHLEGLPVLARKDTFYYRASKFVRRHKLAVGVAGLFLGSLIAFIIMLWVQRADIILQRDRAELVSGFLVNLFEVSDPSRERGETTTARELLDKGARDVEARLRDQPGLLGDLLGTMGTTYTNLGLYPEAQGLLERSLVLRQEAYGTRDPAVATGKQQLANLSLAIDDYARAEQLNREALAARRKRHGDRHPEVVESLYRLALVRQRQGDVAEAKSLFGEAEQGARELELEEALISILFSRGLLARYDDDIDLARSLLEEALSLVEGVWGERHPEVARILNQLAEVERGHNIERSEALFRQALTIQQVVYREPHPDTTHVLNNLALLKKQTGQLKEAEQHFLEVLAMQRAIYPNRSAFEALALSNLGGVLMGQGRFAEAEELYRESLAQQQQILGPRHEETANVHNNLGELLQRTGRFDEAEEHFREALDILLETLGEEHSRVALVHNNLGQLAAGRGDLDAAEQAFEEVVRRLRSISPHHGELPIVLQNLATVAVRRKQWDRADALYQEALGVLEVTGGEDSPEAAMVHVNLTTASISKGNYEAAEASARRAVAIYERTQDPGSFDRLRARRFLAIALVYREELESAEDLAVATLEECQARYGKDVEQCARHASTLAAVRKRL